MLVQLIGFLLLLMAFVSMQLVGLPRGSWVNLVLNLVGASLLTVDALASRQWAFFALECGWVLVALYAIIRFRSKNKSLTPKNCNSATSQVQDIRIQPIKADLTVCKVADYTEIDLNSPYVFTGRTDQEASLVCPADMVPSQTLERSDGWRAFRIQGILDFSLIGILAPIATILADKGIGIFAVSTYNTDYVLTKAEDFPAALDALSNSGYAIS
ncbi:ACT domain-containing protein [Bifidobacterium asteroides]|uniref:ACT domain-containing protein n=1 Tax=Bifidobacterium TaxID=1678 RepID=UPI0021ABB453|nr:ACT domain-containing protein [Bifidobacterium asteroides]